MGTQPAASDAEGWYAYGARALGDGAYDVARRSFENAVAIDPQHANALYRLGELAQGRGEHSAAADFYQRALGVHPGHAGARKRLEGLPRPQQRQPGPRPQQPPPREDPMLVIEPSGQGIFGVVSGLAHRTEYDDMTRAAITVMTFRVDRRDVPAGSAAPVPAMLRGRTLSAGLQNGDWVELPRDIRRGRPIQSLINLSTGEEISSRVGWGPKRVFQWIMIVFVSLWILGVFAAVIAGSMGLDPGAFLRGLFRQ